MAAGKTICDRNQLVQVLDKLPESAVPLAFYVVFLYNKVDNFSCEVTIMTTLIIISDKGDVVDGVFI